MDKSAGVRVVEIKDLPPSEPNAQDVELLRLGGRVFLTYRERPRFEDPNWSDLPERHHLVEFERCLHLTAGGPNDEAIHNHPLYDHGLKPYGHYEVLGGTWIAERMKVQDKDGVVRPRHADLRHFVFAFKEGMFECIAKRYVPLGTFETKAAAVGRAVESALAS